jgi:hypothetical protein
MDKESALIGPGFPPMYPISMSLLIRTLGPGSALYVVPLFAILSMFALGVLGGKLFRRYNAGSLLMLFYAATPLLIWHARAPRPEIIAGFLCIAGIRLLLGAWESKPEAPRFDLALSALSLALAPFFYVTAWFVALSALTWIVAMLLTARSAALVYPPIALAGVITYIWHTVTLADQYQLTRLLRPLLDRAWIWLLLPAVLLSIPFALLKLGRSLQHRSFWSDLASKATPGLCRSLRFAAAIMLLATCAWLYLRTEAPENRIFTEYVYHYTYPTDLRMVRVFFSRPICALGFIGLLMFVAQGKHRGAQAILPIPKQELGD